MGRVPTAAIRGATRADVDALVALQARASVAGLSHIFPPERFPFPSEAVRDRWLAALSDSATETFVASALKATTSSTTSDTATTTPAGLVAVRPGWLEALYVAPEHWGTGLAVDLHAHAISALRSRGCTQAELWVLEENGRARSFYERLGWVPNGKTRAVPFPPHPVDVGYALALDGAGPL